MTALAREGLFDHSTDHLAEMIRIRASSIWMTWPISLRSIVFTHCFDPSSV